MDQPTKPTVLDPRPHIDSTTNRIAAAIPYYAFKGIDRFYDISGLLLDPALFQRTVDILLERYKGMAIDKIGGCVRMCGCIVATRAGKESSADQPSSP